MNHITERLADYLENRLTPAQSREIQKHADDCADCRAELVFAMRLRDAALAQGVAHIHPDRIVALSEDRRTVTSREAQHLDTCESCRSELAWAASAPGGSALAVGEADGISARRTTPSFAKRWWPATAMAIAAVIALWIFVPRGLHETSNYVRLATIEPLPVLISRSAAEPGTFEAARQRGFEAYRDGHNEAASVAFGEALVLRPGDAEMLLYLGSTASLSGDHERAAAHLEEALLSTPGTALREEILWQLANAKLAKNDVAAAKSVLADVARLDLDHAMRAREILAELAP